MRRVGENQNEYLIRVMREEGERYALYKVIALIQSERVTAPSKRIDMDADELVEMIEALIPPAE